MRLNRFKLFRLLSLVSILITGCSQTDNSDKPDIFDGTDDPVEVEHTHTFSDVWSKDEHHHWHESNCEHKGIRKDEAEHTFTVSETPATYESEGLRVYTCSVCFYSKSETIEKLTHSYSTTWEHDHYHHWHHCVDEGYEDIKKDMEDHTFGVEIIDATFEKAGLKTSTCAKCGYSYSVEIPILTHSYDKEWEYDNEGHWHRCIDEGYGNLSVDYATHHFKLETKEATYDDAGLEIYTCEECGYAYTVEIDKLEHNYSSKLSNDDKGHWYACTDKGYETLQNGYQLHNYKVEVIESTFDKKGYSIYTCEECGYKYVDDEVDKIEHNHEDEWTNDAWGHWHACTDEGYEDLKIDYEQHNYESKVTKEAGYYTDGVITNTCEECGYSHTVKLDSLYKQSVNSLTYQLVNNEYYNVSYVPNSLSVVFIPDEYEGLPVRTMNSYIFGSNVKELHLGKNIKSVNYWELNGRTPLLEVLEIKGDFTEIPYYLYNLNNLKTIYLSKNISYIDFYGLSNCVSLENVYIDKDNTYYKNYNDGVYNNDLTTLYFYSRTKEVVDNLPDTLTSIYSYAFRNAKLTSIDLPDSLYQISEQAFYGCNNLESITLPSGLRQINYEAFASCENLREVTFNFGNLYSSGSEIFVNDEKLTTLNFGQNFNSFNGNWFANCNINEINIDENNQYFTLSDGFLMNKYKNTIYRCLSYSEEELVIPSGVSYLVSYAFSNSNIKKVVIPSNVNFGDGCFAYCKNLVEADLSDSTTSYFYQTFANCENLKSVILPTNVSDINIGYYTFYNCASLERIEGLSNATYIDNYSFENCEKLTTIENDIKYIGDGYYNYHLIAIGHIDNYSSNELIFDDDCKFVGGSSFSNLSYAVTKLNLNHVEKVGNYAFAYTYFSEIDFGDNLKRIEGQAFEQVKISEINLPETLEYIGYSAFGYSQDLISISIGKNVNYIDGSAFYGCYNLSSIVVDEENERFFIYKDGLYDKNEKRLIYNLATEDYVIIWAETNYIYWCFADKPDYVLNIVFYEVTYENRGIIWSNNYTNDNYYNSSKYYYSEDSQAGRWHYVEGVPTLW